VIIICSSRSLRSLSALIYSLFLLDESLASYKVLTIVALVRPVVIAHRASFFSNANNEPSIIVLLLIKFFRLNRLASLIKLN